LPRARKRDESFSYTFAALRGVQAGRHYYVAMCPLKLIPKIFQFDEDELPADMRAQRSLNRARVPEITKYMIANPKEYVFSSITASVDASVRFETWDDSKSGIGRLNVPMTGRILINDGQHRRAAIQEALKERPELAEETISVVFFIDEGLKRSQQMFADLNKHAVRPTKSLGILYDLRDPLSQMSRSLISEVPYFKGLTETEKTTISNRSIKLFTLSSIYQGTKALLNLSKGVRVNLQQQKLAIDYWTEVGKQIPDWQLAQARKVTAAELRRDFIHSHGLALHALGIVGAALLASEPKRWKERLKVLSTIDWSRSNAALWEGRAMIGGRVSKAHNNLLLTVSAIKRTMGLTLSAEELRVETSFKKREA
jgi:DNA sulfur modification protein DndB